MTEQIRETAQMQADGRICIPRDILKALDVLNKKAWCECETYGKDKILITVLSKWMPPEKNSSPTRDRLVK